MSSRRVVAVVRAPTAHAQSSAEAAMGGTAPAVTAAAARRRATLTGVGAVATAAA